MDREQQKQEAWQQLSHRCIANMGHNEKNFFDDGFNAGYAAGQRQWIAVSERLPEKNGEYDLTFAPSYADAFVCTKSFIEGCFYHDYDLEPIAWRERPDPYTEPQATTEAR